MQIIELHQKLHEKDEVSKVLEMDIVALKEELSRTQNEVEFWQKRAEKTPAIQVLESELQDVKVRLHFILRNTNNVSVLWIFILSFSSFFEILNEIHIRKAVKMKLPN